jgi:hypothetical protein
MAVLHDQKQRHGVARLVGMRTPLTIVTPTIQKTPADAKMVKSFLTRKYKKLPFALPSAEADRQIKDREQKLAVGLLKNAAQPKKGRPKALPEAAEPVVVKRRIK